MDPQPTSKRACVNVAAGVLVRGPERSEFLAAQRPPGKIAAGKWEFPGGKIEQGETPESALIRELQEEIGVRVTSYRPLIRIHHAYSDRDVRMWVYLIDGWKGEVQGHDGQQLRWGSVSSLRQLDLLGADGPILRALELPDAFPVTPGDLAPEELTALSQRWNDRGYRLRRLRVPAWSDVAYEAAVRGLGSDLSEWVMDRNPELAVKLGAGGFHAVSSTLQALDQRPVPDSMLFGCSVHNHDEWRKALRIGADYVFVSPVQKTVTHVGALPMGWDGFARLTSLGSVPAYALGGVGPDDIPRAQQAWGQGIAGIRCFK